MRESTERVGAYREGRFSVARYATAVLSPPPGSDVANASDEIPRGRSSAGSGEGLPPGEDGNFPRGRSLAQNRVDDPPAAAAFGRLDPPLHRFVQRARVGDAGVEELVRPHPEGVPDVLRRRSFRGDGRGTAEGRNRSCRAGARFPSRARSGAPGPGDRKSPRRAACGRALCRRRPRRGRLWPGPEIAASLTIAVPPSPTRRPWAYAHASIAFPPLAARPEGGGTPSPQATRDPVAPRATIRRAPPHAGIPRRTADEGPSACFPRVKRERGRPRRHPPDQVAAPPPRDGSNRSGRAPSSASGRTSQGRRPAASRRAFPLPSLRSASHQRLGSAGSTVSKNIVSAGGPPRRSESLPSRAPLQAPVPSYHSPVMKS